MNGDNYSDLVIGAPMATIGGVRGGALYVISGKRFPSDVHLKALRPEQGYAIYGASSNDYLGVAASGAGNTFNYYFRLINYYRCAGDVNGDGYDDVIVGALKASQFYEGVVHVLYGGQNHSSSILIAPSVISGTSWSYFGYSVSGAGI